ncbi:MAG: hypothetical protein H7249_15185 [Chitinophagaceae bacterium]|nr:hypothetical protein [Oligoflexus sp.]
MKLLEGQSGLIIILTVIISGYFYFRPHEPEMPATPIANRAAVAQIHAPKEIQIAAPSEVESLKTRETARRTYNLMILNGVTHAPSKSEGNKLILTIMPKPEAQWCKTGDFDLLKALASNTKDKMITLSVEALKKNGVRRAETLSLGEIANARGFRFEIPNTDGAYGIYLCTDQGKKGSCGRKAPINPHIWSAGPGQIKKLAQDKVFYFQMLEVKNGSVNIIPSESWGKDNLKKLKSQLGDWMGSDADALDKMDNLVSKLKPMPSRIAGDRIEIPLPYNDMRCMGH